MIEPKSYVLLLVVLSSLNGCFLPEGPKVGSFHEVKVIVITGCFFKVITSTKLLQVKKLKLN